MLDAMDLVRQEEAYIVALRRHFHAHPELSWKEFETAARIRSELDNMGIPWTAVCETGTIATIAGRSPRPVIGLRADMDALPVNEDSDLPFKSLTPGVMHACGHDAHIAMLLGATKVLAAHRDELDCTIRLIFQPAEEVIQGARRMIDLPEMQGIDNLMAIHIYPMLGVGTISVDAGPRMTSADTIRMTIIGRGGHGSQPHNAVDPIMAGCAVVQNLQTIVSREISPMETCVVSICSFHAGTLSNIIANTAELTGTVRTFNPTVRDALPEIIERVVANTCRALRADYTFEFLHGTPPTINEETSSSRGAAAVRAILGDAGLVRYEKHPGGEDFAWLLERTPGYLAFVGCGNESVGACYPLHHERFRIDENALVNGSALFVQYVLETQHAL